MKSLISSQRQEVFRWRYTLIFLLPVQMVQWWWNWGAGLLVHMLANSLSAGNWASLIGCLVSPPDNKVTRNVVELVDVFPTLSHLAGLEAPKRCPDISFQVCMDVFHQSSTFHLLKVWLYLQCDLCLYQFNLLALVQTDASISDFNILHLMKLISMCLHAICPQST